MTTKWLMLGVLAVLGFAGCSDGTSSDAASNYRLEQVVVVMRHGVRVQTNSEMLARETGHAWPSTALHDGALTAHGAEGVRSQMKWMLDRWRKAGLPLDDGCPERQILPWSSTMARDRDTGEAALDAMFPGCGFHAYYSTRLKDPVMDGGKAANMPLNRVSVAMELDQVIGGSLRLMAERNRPIVELLKQAVCQPGACRFMDQPWDVQIKGNKVSFDGPLKHAANMAETIRLQYSEGLPLDQVAFGNVRSADDVAALMRLKTVRYSLGNDLPEVARHGGSALMGMLIRALQTAHVAESDPLGCPLILFFGHDTNVSQLRAMMGFDWQLPGYPANDIPPAGALVFERYHDRQRDREMIRVSFQARTLDQWRHLTPLNSASPLAESEWHFAGCEDTSVGVLCPLSDALARMSARQSSKLLAPDDYLTHQVERRTGIRAGITSDDEG